MSRYVRQIRGTAAATLLFAAGAFPAWGQRVIAVTQARSATGQAAGLQALSVDFDAGAPLPGGQALPGSALITFPVLDLDRGAVFLNTGQPWLGGALEAPHRESTLTSFRVAPFETWPNADDHTASGWREPVSGVVRDDLTLSHLLVTSGITQAPDGTWQGRLEARPWPPEGTPGRVQAPGGETRLHIGPRYVFPLWGGVFVALGAPAPDQPVLLQRADATTRTAEPPVSFTDGSHPAGQSELAGALLSPDKTMLWVLFSSFSGDAPASWLYAISTDRLAATGPPLALPGIAYPGAQHLAADLRAHCWVATRTPGTDFARITRVAGDAGGDTPGPKVFQTFALVGVRETMAVAVDARTSDALVAMDHRLEYWAGGERGSFSHRFEAPVTALLWAGVAPVVGEGNRLHRLALPDCTPESTISLPQGWVVGAVWIPYSHLPTPDADADGLTDDAERRIQTRPDHADSDGDGIPDGSDPYPAAPSPRLAVGTEVVFPYTAVGRQLRALKIESLGAPDAQWQISFDAEALPWLRIHPRSFRGSGHAYMGVDPEHFDPSGTVSGTLEVSLSGKPRGNRPGYTAAYSPATVHVRVEAPRDPLRTIRWIWPDTPAQTSFRNQSDPQDLRALGDLVSGYPFYFSSVEHFGPVSAALDDSSIVVIPARAAAEGALTQMTLFEYLSSGGAVLFLGEHLTGEHFRDLGTWLAPLEVKIDMTRAIGGVFPANNTSDLLRNWGDFALENGCAMAAAWPGDVAVPDGADGQVFIARTHGYGRIAFLASPTPLTTAALTRPENRAFALDLFYWLSRAGYAVDDLDGDGLLDGTEDRNDNGAVDEGETAWLDPDTDGDGLPDGLEDTNRNGAVDQGETDPRQADTDGDGTPDGADGTSSRLASG